MNSQVTLREALPCDSRSIAQLISAGFDPALRSYYIVGCSGFDKFIEDQLRTTDRLGPRFFVAEVAGRIVATVELRASPRLLHLNHIFVDSGARERGLGAALLGMSLEYMRSSQTGLSLDVFSSNRKALEWYLRLGLSEGHRTHWQLLKLDKTEHSSGAQGTPWLAVVDPLSKEKHARYGFSAFRMQSGARSCTVGLLGDDYLRISDSSLAKEEDFIKALHQTAPARSILCLGERIPDARVLDVSVRLDGDLETALARLSKTNSIRPRG